MNTAIVVDKLTIMLALYILYFEKEW